MQWGFPFKHPEISILASMHGQKMPFKPVLQGLDPFYREISLKSALSKRWRKKSLFFLHKTKCHFLQLGFPFKQPEISIQASRWSKNAIWTLFTGKSALKAWLGNFRKIWMLRSITLPKKMSLCFMTKKNDFVFIFLTLLLFKADFPVKRV